MTQEEEAERALEQRRSGWQLAMMAGAMVLTLLLTVAITSRMLASSERAAAEGYCEILSTQLAVYRELPPTTPTGQSLARAYEAKYAEDCVPRPKEKKS